MGSPFASRTTETVPMPFDPAHTATLRKLTGRELDKAQEVHLRNTIAGRWASHGWAAEFQRQLEKGVASNTVAERMIRDPLNGYDRHTLVTAGLMAWSYTDPVLSEQAIEDLDDDALDWFAVEILKRTKPGLFQTVDEAEAARKNGSGASIAP